MDNGVTVFGSGKIAEGKISFIVLPREECPEPEEDLSQAGTMWLEPGTSSSAGSGSGCVVIGHSRG